MEGNNEEMDLISLTRWMCSRVKDYFLKSLRACGNVLKLAYRNKVVVLVFAFIGIGVGLYSSFPPIYRGELILRVPSSSLTKSVLDEFNVTKHRTGDADVMSRLKLSPQVVEDVRLIRAFYVVTEKNNPNRIKKIVYGEKVSLPDTLSVLSESRICLQILSCSESSFVEVQNAVIDYLRNIPEIGNDSKRQIYYLKTKIDMLNSEISKLDSMSKINYFSRFGISDGMEMKVNERGSLSMVEKGKTLFHEDMIELYNAREVLMKDLDYMECGSVGVSSPLLIKRYPYNFWLKEIIIFGGLFIFVGLIFVAFLENRKRIKQYLEEK